MKKYKITNKGKTRSQLSNPFQDITHEQYLEGSYPFTVGLDNERKMQAIESFKSVWDKIVLFQTLKKDIQLTSDNYIKFTLIFKNNEVLMISKPIDCKEFKMQENEIIYSFFIDKKLIISGILEINDFCDKFEKYRKLKGIG